MIANEIKALIINSARNLDLPLDDVHLEHPDILSYGDYSTNAALLAAKSAGKSPREIADALKGEIDKNLPKEIERVEVAGAGFINFHLARSFFAQSIDKVVSDSDFGRGDTLQGRKVMFEYTDPNPFKPFHIGHLMSNAIGEAFSRIAENVGAKVIRANYQGDVGLHVAKAIYGIMQEGSPNELTAERIGLCYTTGSRVYEEDADAKKRIDEINKKVYDKTDPEINRIYDQGKEITLEAFESIYEKLGTKFDDYFFESEMAAVGTKLVSDNTPKVFEISEGATVFRGEKYDPKLHTRVFITSQGLPAYETKELGLTMKKFEKESPDISVIVTAVEQKDYMRVVTEAIRQIDPEIAVKMLHVTHGMMRFAEGKMSSRKGNVITGESLISDVEIVVDEKIKDRELSEEERKKIREGVAVGAIKYSILRQSPGRDIIFDRDKSLSFEGDSGPYLQYALVRASSILERAGKMSVDHPTADVALLEKLLYRFPEVTSRAWQEKAPQLIVEYLTVLAGAFNRFYAEGLIVSDTPDSPYKVAVTKAFETVMGRGLELLAIPVLAKM